MRLWSLHPKYLDGKGLVALWREALLAKKVLQNKTKGYKNHPQLIRFKTQSLPVDAINLYLQVILSEASGRKYNFNTHKVEAVPTVEPIPVSEGQIRFEFNHLLQKLRKRNRGQYDQLKHKSQIDMHPLFRIVPGDIEQWEKI